MKASTSRGADPFHAPAEAAAIALQPVKIITDNNAINQAQKEQFSSAARAIGVRAHRRIKYY
jgi:hypothetical protein